MTDGGWHDSEQQPVLAVSDDGSNWTASYSDADLRWTLRRDGDVVSTSEDPEVDASAEAAERWLAPHVADLEVRAYLAAKISRRPAEP